MIQSDLEQLAAHERLQRNARVVCFGIDVDPMPIEDEVEKKRRLTTYERVKAWRARNRERRNEMDRQWRQRRRARA